MRVERLRRERQRRLAAGVTAPTNNNNNNKDGSNSNGNTLTNSSQSFNNNPNLNPDLGSDPLLVSLTSSATPLPIPTSKAPFSNTHTRMSSNVAINANVGKDNTKNNTDNTKNNTNNTNTNTHSTPGSTTTPGAGVVNSSVPPQKSGVLTNCVDDPLSS